MGRTGGAQVCTQLCKGDGQDWISFTPIESNTISERFYLQSEDMHVFMHVHIITKM